MDRELRGFPDSCRPRFQPERLLGEGGFGRVFLAREVSLGRSVAIKVLTAIDDEASRGRFAAEARATAALHHPGIVQVIEHGGEPDTPWIAYEFLPGETLRTVLARGPLTVRAVLELGIQLAGALQEAHEHGVIHRDVKPENVIALGGGLHKIIDFGIARWAGSSVRTRTGVIVGTPAYLAPEVIQGADPGAPADVYALGVMLFELIAGQVPFQGKHPLDVLDAHLKRTPPSLSSRCPGVPPSTDALVRRALAKDPRERTPTMAQLRQALERERNALDQEAGRRRPPLLPRPRADARVVVRPLLAAVTIAAVFIGIALLSRRTGQPGKAPSMTAVVDLASRDHLLDTLRAFGARDRLVRLSETWRGAHTRHRSGDVMPGGQTDEQWLSFEWGRITEAFETSGAARATAAYRRAIEAKAAPLSAEDLPAYQALHQVADVHALFRDASQHTRPAEPYSLLDCTPEPWRGRSPPALEWPAVFALVSREGGRSQLSPGSEGTCAQLRLVPAWPHDNFHTLDFQRDRPDSDTLLGTMSGVESTPVLDRWEYEGHLPWEGARALELGACARGWEERDAIDACFMPRGGGAPISLVLRRWRRDRQDGYLRVDPALIPRDARLVIRLHEAPWRAGAGLNIEWVAARWLPGGGLPLPRNAPSPRNNTALAYDPVCERILLFGGTSRRPGNHPTREWMEGDTWYWTGERWIPVETGIAPPGGCRHRLITERGRVLLVGGKVSGDLFESLPRTEAWEWDGLRWKSAGPAVERPEAPLPPGAPAFGWSAHVFDTVRKRYVLVGATPGAMQSPPSGELQTWVTTAGGWTQVRTAGTPPTRNEFGLAHDPRRGVTVLFGGQSHGLTHGDTWEFDGRNWTRKDSRPPVSRPD